VVAVVVRGAGAGEKPDDVAHPTQSKKN
jgi:hypothetical protein